MKKQVLIIGLGPGGIEAANLAADLGYEVIAFEKEKEGGVCLNSGCIPSKTLLNSAKIVWLGQGGKNYGVLGTQEAYIDHSLVLKRKERTIRRLGLGIKAGLEGRVKVIHSQAEILEKHEDKFIVKAGEDTYSGDYLIIATGSKNFTPPIEGVREGLENGFILTNKEILELEDVPKRLAIIGAGAVGLEMAMYYAAAGSEVSIIEMQAQIAPNMDEEIGLVLKKSLEKKGIKIELESKVVKIEENTIFYSQAGETKKLDADKVLMAVGRVGATEGIGLESLGIERERSFIKTDNFLRTNVKNVFAIGDCNGKALLAHAASRQGLAAIRNFDGDFDNFNLNAMPAVVFTQPELASVGYTLEKALKEGFDADEVKIPLMFSGRYVAENTEVTGICKIIFDKKNEVLLGAHLVSPEAGEIISIITSYIDLKAKIGDIEKIILPHPTVSEIFHSALYEIAKKLNKLKL